MPSSIRPTVTPSAPIARSASRISPVSAAPGTAAQVPTRIARRIPRPARSSRTIAALGPPMPVDWIVSGVPAGVSPV